jgi:hypothetical protein
LGPDGSPTELYKKFRNPTISKGAAAIALRSAYSALYELNEYVHDASEKDVKGYIVQVTGLEPESPTIRAMHGSFKALRSFADFDATITGEADDGSEPIRGAEVSDLTVQHGVSRPSPLPQLRLGYTINLNLPNTTDVAVFNAIFKSLREHLLTQSPE